jgi:hypothetical protein
MQRALRDLLWRLSDRRDAHGFPIGYSKSDADSMMAQARVTAAFDLIAATWPRWLQRTRTYVDRVQVRRVIQSIGEWHGVSRQVDLDYDYLCRPEVSIAAIASTIVHECTHARIHAAGIPYIGAERIRIERACVGQELAFVRALADDEAHSALLARIANMSEHADDVWSSESNERRSRAALQTIGVPRWLADVTLRLRKWLARASSAA